MLIGTTQLTIGLNNFHPIYNGRFNGDNSNMFVVVI